MNRTLFECGFKKQDESKTGQLCDIKTALPKSVKLTKKSLKCSLCKKVLSGKQILDLQLHFKHKPGHNTNVQESQVYQLISSLNTLSSKAEFKVE